MPITGAGASGLPLQSKFGLLCIVPLWFLPCTHGAVIEVTAGGAVSDPTYRFSDSSGNQLATFTSDSTGKITASGNVETGSGNSVDGLATGLAIASAYAGARFYCTAACHTLSVTASKVSWSGSEYAANADQTALSSSKFQPTVSGTYSCTVQGTGHYAGVLHSIVEFHLYRNGVPHSGTWTGCSACNTGWVTTHTLTDILELNGSTDYVEVYLSGTAGHSWGSNKRNTFFHCHRI